MINNFDDATKTNLNKILYKNDDRSEASNIRGNNHSVETHPTGYRDSNPLYKICNTRELDLQVELTFNTYQVREIPWLTSRLLR